MCPQSVIERLFLAATSVLLLTFPGCLGLPAFVSSSGGLGLQLRGTGAMGRSCGLSALRGGAGGRLPVGLQNSLCVVLLLCAFECSVCEGGILIDSVLLEQENEGLPEGWEARADAQVMFLASTLAAILERSLLLSSFLSRLAREV